MPYSLINGKATGENILRRRIEMGCTVLDMQRYLNLACPQSTSFGWRAPMSTLSFAGTPSIAQPSA